jgi:hemolysin III
VLGLAWGLAAVGIVLRFSPFPVSRDVFTGLCLLMGWGILLCYFELARRLSHRAMRLTLVGGALYTIGAVLDLVRWPVLVPRVFSAHEVFHLFVMAASFAHYWFMLTVIAPFPGGALAVRPGRGRRRGWPRGRPAAAGSGLDTFSTPGVHFIKADPSQP